MQKLWKRNVLFVFTWISLLVLIGYTLHPVPQMEMQGMISVAHRGASGFAPENTQSAFQIALSMGADILECDIHLTKDGELVIMHDDKVDRTTNGIGYIRDFTLEELKELDVGGNYHASFAGEQISTLREFLDEFYGQAGLLIELKKPVMYPGIEEKVAAVLTDYKDLRSVVIQSFDIESMRKMHDLLPELEIAILISPSVRYLSTTKIEDMTSFATYINFNVMYVDKRMVDRVHKHGGKVLVWSTKNRFWVEKAFQIGADGIITDFSIWPIGDQVQLVVD